MHGIHDGDVAGAPTLVEVWPQLLDAIGDRAVVAYNCDYDLEVLTRDAGRLGLPMGHLGDRRRWHCAMEWRRRWLGLDAATRLGGGHRAVDDCLAAREVLLAMAAGPPLTVSDAA